MLLAILCVLLEGVFTSLEVALGAVSRGRLRALADDDAAASTTKARANRTLRLLERPDRLTILFVTITSLSLWTAATCLVRVAERDAWPLWSLPLAFMVALFFAEVLPLVIAARFAEALALRGSALVRRVDWLLWPLTWLLGMAGRVLARALGARFDAPPHVTQDELKTALQTAEEEGVLEGEERAMLEGAMNLRDKRLRDVMSPRVKIVGVRADASARAALEIGLRAGRSRLPVYEGTLDHVLGVLALKDLLPHLRDGKNDAPIRDFLRAPLFLPESTGIAPALNALRRNRTLLALVYDESGGTAGLVTLEDLLEEIVGELDDEYDSPQQLAKPELDGLRCDASLPLREVTRAWREARNAVLQLRGRDGEAVETSLLLGEFALRVCGSNALVGARALAGMTRDDDGEATPVELEVTRCDANGFAELRLRAREIEPLKIEPTEKIAVPNFEPS